MKRLVASILAVALWGWAPFFFAPAMAGAVDLVVDTAHPVEMPALTRYALGQGGLSVDPMFEAHADEVALLKPQTIRLFVQEYFDLYPAAGRFHWETLDRSIENILATGARPLLCLCFKPRALYPQVNQDIVHPTDYAEWERLIEAMVRHCSVEKRYGIEYWEIGNEVDIGESGGCPFRFQPGDYTNYYARTAGAILRADAKAKVGGPALASAGSPIGDALIEFCGQGGAPLHFFSWHLYDDNPANFRRTIRSIKGKLARYPRLAATETILDEWNIALVRPEPATGFQAAFVLETTRGFLEEGLSRAAYYHIRDYRVDPAEFAWMSPEGLKFMADWWNVKPQNSGLYDNQGRRRPAYYAFQMLSHLQGQQLPVSGAAGGIHALAARHDGMTEVVLWNFPDSGPKETHEVALRFTEAPRGSFRLVRVDAATNRLETLRTGSATELEAHPIQVQLPPHGVAWVQIGTVRVRASWGHRSPKPTPFYVRPVSGSASLGVGDAAGFQLEAGEGRRDGAWQTTAGAGDVDGVEFGIDLPAATNNTRRQEHSIWSHLLQESDPDTTRRLRQDPGFQVNPPRLTFQMNAAGTRGFSISVDQLFEQERLWVPEFDMYLSLGPPFADFEAHQRALAPRAGWRVLDQTHRQPEATYAQFTNRWEDMGHPAYRNPHSVAPGHTVGLTWDSAIPKFGIDRQAGVINDYGNPDHFRLAWDLGSAVWKGQRLTDGLPVLVTSFEQEGVRWEIEQFAYPLHGPPPDGRGDIEMVLLQKIRVNDLTGGSRTLPFRLRHDRDLPAQPTPQIGATNLEGVTLFTDRASGLSLLSVQGSNATVSFTWSSGATDEKRQTAAHKLGVTVSLSLPAHGTSEVIVKLPSPVLSPADRSALLRLNYTAARAATLRFWSECLERGALFRVPEQGVNDLFRASLWHARSLPRRHGGFGPDAKLDLPYSNFAYDQSGMPWPVNQAVYVDYMLYDLRGYPDMAREELLAMYRSNQGPDGRVGGYANWGVYTPGMVYAAAKHYRLSHDRASFEHLLPATLKAADWCVAELRRANTNVGAAQGLVLAPLNDLSHEPKAWAFNQAYFYAGLSELGQVLAELGHPRANEFRTASAALQQAISRGFGQASLEAPVVQLRDHTWSPYVPADALTPRRLFEVWYPTDVDTGALHLSRLKALGADDPLTLALLHDHEDNLFLKGWGMANEPVYNQQATAYLLRDDARAVIRAFYSMMACAFSHSVFEPVEHRWGWGQYFGPPSTDGAWFELYRHMLIHERDDGSLLLGQATPRAWLEDGKRIEVQRAPTYYGPLSFVIASRAGTGEVEARLSLNGLRRPDTILVRLRHPTEERIGEVTVNGRPWPDFDPANEWVRIPTPRETNYVIRAQYQRPASRSAEQASDDSSPKRLADEVKNKGWIAYAARSQQRDWDLFACRPDGSAARNLTRTPAYSEFSPQFSRDGRRLLYRRIPREESIDNNNHGTQGVLVVANADGSSPEVIGEPGEFPWASWSPDGRQIATLSIKGIFLVDVATRQVVKRFDRKGFFQQVTWSPDGQWLCGVANSFGASWSIARLNLATGEASAVNLIDCCTPDWFPDSKSIIFSWRPPGQEVNKGYGWTQLWMADAEGQTRKLVYGEDGRHVYGGNISPDGRYVLFTGNVEEDGDPVHAGAPMGLMRIQDAPIIRGESKELRALHPGTKEGPVLTLPSGWEPCWTDAEIFSRQVASAGASGLNGAASDSAALARELHDKGWLIFSAASGNGDWDLFLMRPDGSARRPLTDTRDYNEAGGRFSPDGHRLLYYRMPTSEAVDNNTYGTFELVLSDADGRQAEVLGNAFPWATWGPDSSQIACLGTQGIEIIELASRKVLRRLPRKGMVQQLVWSPDGEWFTGTANGLGPYWNIGCMKVETGELRALSEVERYNCTPDWLPDSSAVLYARGIIPPAGGRAELWLASRDGKARECLYAEEGRHIYGGCASPDGKYLLFTRSVEDLGKVDQTRTTMAIIRRSDAPMLGDDSVALRQGHPQARRGPRLDLGPGWEPHWTYAETPGLVEGKDK